MNESPDLRQNTDSRTRYSAPDFTRHDLRLITRGGTPGAGDSSPANSQPPTSGQSMENHQDELDSSY